MAEPVAKAGLQAVSEQPQSNTKLPSYTYIPKTANLWRVGWIITVILPFCAALIYFIGIATDRYISEAKVIVKKAGSGEQSLTGIPLLGASLGLDMHDALLVRDYILSDDMLYYLQDRLQLRQHYQNTETDRLSRLHSSASSEAFLAYYREHIEISIDETSGVLTIRAQGFEPQYAQLLVKTIIERSEIFINQISQRLAQEHVAFVQGEMVRAQQKLKDSKQRILSFQDQYQLVSPALETDARLQVVNELEAELIRLQTELKNLRNYMNETAADIVILRSRVAAVESQLAIERDKLVGTQQQQNMTTVNANFAELQLEMEFATDVYKTSLIGLEQARIEAYRKLKHLVVVDSPSLPEMAEYPRRVYSLFTLFICLSLIYGLISIIAATIREHR